MSKAPKLFNNEHFYVMSPITPEWAAFNAQRIFQDWYADAFSVGYVSKGEDYPEDDWCHISSEQCKSDTHRIRYMVEKLEEEPEVYCELGQRIHGLVGIDDDTRNVLLDLLDKCGMKLEGGE